MGYWILTSLRRRKAHVEARALHECLTQHLDLQGPCVISHRITGHDAGVLNNGWGWLTRQPARSLTTAD